MEYSVIIEKIIDGSLPADYYYAHVPALDLTTHGQGIEGAREAARDLITAWIQEKAAHGESVPGGHELYISILDIPDAVRSA